MRVRYWKTLILLCGCLAPFLACNSLLGIEQAIDPVIACDAGDDACPPPAPCEPGARACSGGSTAQVFSRCSADRAWVTEAVCNGACDDETGCIPCEERSIQCDGLAMYVCQAGAFMQAKICPFGCDPTCGGYPVGLWDVVRSCHAADYIVQDYYIGNPPPDTDAETCPDNGSPPWELTDAPVRMRGQLEVWPDGTVVVVWMWRMKEAGRKPRFSKHPAPWRNLYSAPRWQCGAVRPMNGRTSNGGLIPSPLERSPPRPSSPPAP